AAACSGEEHRRLGEYIPPPAGSRAPLSCAAPPRPPVGAVVRGETVPAGFIRPRATGGPFRPWRPAESGPVVPTPQLARSIITCYHRRPSSKRAATVWTSSGSEPRRQKGQAWRASKAPLRPSLDRK